LASRAGRSIKRRTALDLLAGSSCAEVYHNSTDQDDYRWGYLHRITFDHPFVSLFSVPPAAGAFLPPLGSIDGIPTDGGFGTVDASSHNPRADHWASFGFGSGPVRRFAGEPTSAFGSRTESVWAGGVSGVPGSPYYFNILPYWLSNNTLPTMLKPSEVKARAERVIRFEP
jgi:penicillin amidase